MRQLKRSLLLTAILVAASTTSHGLQQPNERNIHSNTATVTAAVASPFTDNGGKRRLTNLSDTGLDTVAVFDIDIRGSIVWLGTARGVMFSSNLGSTWISFDSSSGIGRGMVTGLSTSPSGVWLATSYDTAQTLKGSGLSWTSNAGTNWFRIPQPIDDAADTILVYFGQQIPAFPITTDLQNVTYDIGQTNSSMFIASFTGGLRKSTDAGNSWQRILLPGDTMTYINSSNAAHVGRLDPRLHNNHMAFSVLCYDVSGTPIVWAGTANGVNKSTDGGLTWRKYNSLYSGISGSWIVTLHRQQTLLQDILWTSSWIAQQNESNGVSFTTNSGATWQSTLIGKRAHEISSLGDTTFVSSDSGLFRSTNGALWQRFAPTGGYRIYDAVKDTMSRLWVGSDDGVRVFQDSNALWYDVANLGGPPHIVSVVAPTVLVRPPTGSIMDSAWIQTTDPDGLADVDSAWFHAYRPNGSSTYIPLQNWGDGKFGIRFILDSTGQLGTHRWVFFAKDREGNVSDSATHFINIIVTSVDEAASDFPATFVMAQNYPNPFNPGTTIKFSIPTTCYVLIDIFNGLGQTIATLVSQELPPGSYLATWNASAQSSGIYYYRMRAGTFVQTRKLAFIK